MLLSRTQITAILISIVVIGGFSTGVWYIVNQADLEDIPEPPIDQEPSNTTIYADITTSVDILETEFYKGQNIPATVTVTANTTANISSIYVDVQQPFSGEISSRIATQEIYLNQTVGEGETEIPFEITPAFNYRGFVALTNSSYFLTGYNVSFTPITTKENEIPSPGFDTGSLSVQVTGKLYETFDQISKVVWTNSSSGDISFSQNEGNLTVQSATGTGSLNLSTTIQTEAYTRLHYDYNASANTQVDFYFDNVKINETSDDYLHIGNYQKMVNFTVRIVLNGTQNMYLNLSMPTRHVAIFTLIASNNWESPSDDSFIYREAGFYISQASNRFERMFNVSIIPVVTVDFEFEFDSTIGSLRQIINDTQNSVGETLNLVDNEGNFKWQQGLGGQPENGGADILLVFTNQTLEYFGMVLWPGGIPGNIGAHARGSTFNGNWRLPPSMADNLIQHEVSHIFKAPDRFTNSDAPSIMTKSQPEDAVDDILFGRHFLFLTSWLEKDVQTMMDYIFYYG